MITVIGATGNTGKTIAEKLLARGEKVRVVSRKAKHLAALKKLGAETFVAEATDKASLTDAFKGARAAYVMIPPNISTPDVPAYQEKVSQATAAALEDAGVEYAVLLSSIGADKPAKTGPVVALHNFEQKLEKIGRLNVLCLRAGYFMENLLPQKGVIKAFGIVGGPLKADLAVPMIATKDIGSFAAEALMKLDFKGKQKKELLGAREVTYNEVAGIIGRAIGTPALSYQQLPAAQLKPALESMGMSPSMAALLLEMSEALNTGYMVALEARSAANTTPTTVEQYVSEEFVPAFNS